MVVRRSREEWKIYGNVFDTFTKRVLFSLAQQGVFNELSSPVALGKEANVFSATPGRESDSSDRVIVKIYRLENCNFKKMHEYLRQDPRYMHTKQQKREIVFAWCQREYRNLLLAREAIRVPLPIAFNKNVLVTSLIGDAKSGTTAPMLKDAPPQDPVRFCREILDNVASLWRAGLVHGDLSAFNILNYDEIPIFIDFSQATKTKAPNAREMLHRDLRNIALFFKKLDVHIDPDKEMVMIEMSGSNE